MRRNNILDVEISTGSFSESIENIFLLAKRKESSYICICNVHMLIEAKKSIEFNNILRNADIITPDGMPITKILSLKYKINQERVSGMDILPELMKECSERDKSIFLYGSRTNILNSIINKAKNHYPQLKIQCYSPPFRDLSDKEEEKIISKINKCNPDFVFVSLGCPKQEKWMAKHKGLINSCMIGLGGAFLVYSGHQKRAPQWMCDNSLEWLYRLSLEPKRLFRRYLITNSLFIWYVCKEFLKRNNK